MIRGQDAVIGGEVLCAAVRDVPAALLAPIGQDLSLLPMTEALLDSFADGGGHGVLGFWRFRTGSRRSSPTGRLPAAAPGKDEFTAVGLGQRKLTFWARDRWPE
ncbi:hypothetical protein [Streptomyces sp. NPDC055099]